MGVLSYFRAARARIRTATFFNISMFLGPYLGFEPRRGYAYYDGAVKIMQGEDKLGVFDTKPLGID
jgi:hypothetical protein